MNYILNFILVLLFIKNTVSNIYPHKEWKDSSYTYEYNATLSPNIEEIKTLSPCSINVTWSCDECYAYNPTKFVIYWTTSETEESAEVDNTTYNYVVGGLDAATNYSIYVSAIYNNDELQEYESQPNYQVTNPGDPPDIDYIFVTQSSINETSITVLWNTRNSECPMVYKIQWNGSVLCNGTFDTGNDVTDQTLYVMTELQPYTDYSITITAVSTDEIIGNSKEKSDVITEELDPPDIINATVNDVTATTISLSWTAAENLEHCPVKYKTSYNGSILCPLGLLDAGSQISETTEIVLFALNPYTNYTIYIKSISYSGKIGRAYTIEDTITSQAAPGAPENLKATALNSSSVVLTWEPPWQCNGILLDYIVSWKLTDNDTTVGNVTMPDLTYEVDNLLECGTYEFFVQGTTSVGAGEPATTTNRTMAEAPSPIEIFEAEYITSRSVILTWKPPDTHCPVYSYSLEGSGTVLCDDRKVTDQGTVSGNETLYEIDDLIPWTDYSICIRATTEGGTSESTCTQFQTLQDVPGSPENPASSALNSSSVQVEWKPPKECNGILLDYSVSWKLTEYGIIDNVTTPDLTYEVDNLLECGTYEFFVQATTSVGAGEPATTSSRTMAEAPPPVEIFEPENITARSVILTWKPPDTHCPVFNYTLVGIGTVLWDDEHVTDEGTVSGNETLYKADDLIPWTNYSICITAITEGGSSEPACTDFETLEDVPGIPANLKVIEESITSDGFKITWNEPEEKNGQLTRFKITLNKTSKYFVDYETSEADYELTFDSLMPNCKYVVDVYAETSAGFGEPSETSATTLPDIIREDRFGDLGLILVISIPIIIIVVPLIGTLYCYRDSIRARLRSLRENIGIFLYYY